MKTRTVGIALGIAGVIGAAGYGLYSLGMSRGMRMASPEPSAAQSADGRRILYWHDPMVPGRKFDKPGKSPFMDMELVPVYAEGDGDQGASTISPRMQQNLGVRTAQVTKSTLAPAVEAVGSVVWNERDMAVVQARSNGFVERLFVRAPLDPVRKGQPLAELYVPDWVAAQEEYLSARRMAGTRLESLIDGARQRMRLAGMTEEQIRLVESSGKVLARLTVTAPIDGVVAELGAREGMTVMPGAMLFHINGLRTVWVNAELRESQAGDVQAGNLVEARAAAVPGVVFAGRVSAILPEVNLATRTLKARVELSNIHGQLKPGMFATVNFAPAARTEALLVPTEAVIQTGKRSVVIVEQEAGKFSPVDVEIGREVGDRTEIRKGLQAGQKAVVSGQFLVDSEASLRGAATRMEAPPGSGETSALTYRSRGKVEAVRKEEVTLSHDPIPSLRAGAMTMAFKLPASGLPKNFRVGDVVDFDFRQMQDGEFEIVSISPAKPK